MQVRFWYFGSEICDSGKFPNFSQISSQIFGPSEFVKFCKNMPLLKKFSFLQVGRVEIVFLQRICSQILSIFLGCTNRFYIDQVEKIGWKKVVWDQIEPYRFCDRVHLPAEDLGSLIWSRVGPFFDFEYKQTEEMPVSVGYVPVGTWRPQQLNRKMRICKYHPGGLFGPHTDGNFVEDATHRSVYTFMIYLNDSEGVDYEGGSTDFLDEKVRALWREILAGKVENSKFCVFRRGKNRRRLFQQYHFNPRLEWQSASTIISFIRGVMSFRVRNTSCAPMFYLRKWTTMTSKHHQQSGGRWNYCNMPRTWSAQRNLIWQ
jgi:hypothetical protein